MPHEIVLPKSRTRRLLYSYQHPDQAALVARVPLIGRRVPFREFWRHQPIEPRRATHNATAKLIAYGMRATDTARRVADRGRHAGANAYEQARHAPEAAEAMRRRLPGRRRSRLPQMKMPAMPEMHLPEMQLPAMRNVQLPEMHLPDVRLPAAPMLRRNGVNGGTRRLGGMRWTTVLFWVDGFIAGLLVMYYLDPHQGRRRRALVRDKVVHMRHQVTRDLPRAVERRGRFFRGVAKGVGHHAADMVLPNGEGPVDDDTLVSRVRSEVLRDHDIKAGEILVDAYEGEVTLRGQLDRPEHIRELVDRTKHVAGVRSVRSYLHLPGTPPPNMAEVYERQPRPAHITRNGG
jgi:hypothetical protein